MKRRSSFPRACGDKVFSLHLVFTPCLYTPLFLRLEKLCGELDG